MAGDESPTTYWCKDHTGFITERVTTAFEGHRGHVLCVPVDHTRPALSPSRTDQP